MEIIYNQKHVKNCGTPRFQYLTFGRDGTCLTRINLLLHLLFMPLAAATLCLTAGSGREGALNRTSYAQQVNPEFTVRFEPKGQGKNCCRKSTLHTAFICKNDAEQKTQLKETNIAAGLRTFLPRGNCANFNKLVQM